VIEAAQGQLTTAQPTCQDATEGALLHGGNLQQASARYGIAVTDWLDLSTGINPRSYPFTAPALKYYQQLPYCDPSLLASAKQYYQAENLLAVAGTQALINQLPALLPTGTLWVPEVGYQEYAHQWQRQGRALATYPSLHLGQASDAISLAIDHAINAQQAIHLVVINPNNPTGLLFSASQLRQWACALQQVGGTLVVDEAFMDASPEQSLLHNELNQQTPTKSRGTECIGDDSFPDNLILLRSFGKFFGLAGLRLGFVIAAPHWLSKLTVLLGPWAVNGVAQQIAIEAFQDHGWQQRNQQDIHQDARCTRALLKPLLDYLSCFCQDSNQNQANQANTLRATPTLFTSIVLARGQAEHVKHCFALQGIFLRHIPMDQGQSIIRVGNVRSDDQANLARLDQAVTQYLEVIGSRQQSESLSQ